MSGGPDPIRRLVIELSRLPGVGEKTATRLAFYILRSPEENVRSLAQALLDVREKIRTCSVCCHFTERDPCQLCGDPRRDKHTICVVGQPSDVLALERLGSYRGTYHVLHGLLSPLDGIGPDDLRLAELLHRFEAQDDQPREIILATPPNVEGEATAMYLARLLKPLGVAVSRIASGVPMGGDLEHVDGVTLHRALEARHAL